MMPEAYQSSKKTDAICEDHCSQATRCRPSISSRLRCIYPFLDLKLIIFLLIFIPTLLLSIYTHGQKITYFLRPLWQSGPKPFIHLTHYYNPDIPIQHLCYLHGWKTRPYPRRVFDAVIFNNELDMLELRWQELSPYITHFVLLESNSTFTAIPKPLFFNLTRSRFNFVQPRLVYGSIPGRFRPHENPFIEEAYQRVALDQLLKLAGIEDDDLLIMSDVDEIPSRHTINLLRWCDNTPDILHLKLNNYMYSYEFKLDDKSWRASVHRYRSGKTRYAHFRQSDYLLSDSGWHCSFCFRKISEFVFKMKAYSHSDRVRSRFLNKERIQDVICKGNDLFDMLPEEYTFRELIGKMGPIPKSYSAVNLPAYLLENVDKYKYLLPGNCVRERG